MKLILISFLCILNSFASDRSFYEEPVLIEDYWQDQFTKSDFASNKDYKDVKAETVKKLLEVISKTSFSKVIDEVKLVQNLSDDQLFSIIKACEASSEDGHSTTLGHAKGRGVLVHLATLTPADYVTLSQNDQLASSLLPANFTSQVQATFTSTNVFFNEFSTIAEKPRICLRYNLKLNDALQTLVHELTHLTAKADTRHTAFNSVLGFKNLSKYAVEEIESKGGELEAFKNGHLFRVELQPEYAKNNLASQAMIDYYSSPTTDNKKAATNYLLYSDKFVGSSYIEQVKSKLKAQITETVTFEITNRSFLRAAVRDSIHNQKIYQTQVDQALTPTKKFSNKFQENIFNKSIENLELLVKWHQFQAQSLQIERESWRELSLKARTLRDIIE